MDTGYTIKTVDIEKERRSFKIGKVRTFSGRKIKVRRGKMGGAPS